MSLKTFAVAASAVIALSAFALPAHALNPQPLPPKESKASIIKRDSIYVLKRHTPQQKALSSRFQAAR